MVQMTGMSSSSSKNRSDIQVDNEKLHQHVPAAEERRLMPMEMRRAIQPPGL
jgi:hypothetical protein